MIPDRFLAAGILCALVFILPAAAESPYGCNSSSLNGTWITLAPTGYANYAGDNVTITGITNLEAGQDVLVKIFGASWCSMKDYCWCPGLGGAEGRVKVEGGTCGLNQTVFVVNTSSFSPGEFLVTEQAVGQTANDSALLILLTPASFNATMAHDECVAARSQPLGPSSDTNSAIIPIISSGNITSGASPAAVFSGSLTPTPVTTATPTPRSGIDAVPVIGVLGLCGVIFLSRKNGK